MKNESRLKIAIQKKGRLNKSCISTLKKCGMDFDVDLNKLKLKCQNFPLDIILMRDDDIPEYIKNRSCHLGIVGLNVLEEKKLKFKYDKNSISIVDNLNFGKCKLSLSFPKNFKYEGFFSLKDKKIATSHPHILKNFSILNNLNIKIININGSVEIAPSLGVSDGICDLVSTGNTLELNGLKSLYNILESNAVLIENKSVNSNLDIGLKHNLEILIKRIDGVKNADGARYIMMNAPKTIISDIKNVIPGMEGVSIMNLHNSEDKVAVHVVTYENIFWETIEKLKSIGASSILVMPIEKIIK